MPTSAGSGGTSPALVGFGVVERARVGNMANTLGGFNALYGCKQRIARMTVDFMDFMDEGRSLTSPWRGDFSQRRGGRAPWTAVTRTCVWLCL